MPAIARVETGSLTPALSRGERVSRPARRNTPTPLPCEPSRFVPANTRLTLRHPRSTFSFSLREKAGMRAARSTPRATAHGPTTCPHLGKCFGPGTVPRQPSRGLKPAPSPRPSPVGRGCRVLPVATPPRLFRASRRDSFQPTPGSPSDTRGAPSPSPSGRRPG
jgi:hypothetical protein